MLRTFLVGAVAAFVGNRLIKANAEGRLDGLKAQVKDGADRLRKRLSEHQDALITPAPAAARSLPPPPQASRRARKSADPLEVSKPAKAHPWPVDPKAMPSEG
jgi:hypothetical protein